MCIIATNKEDPITAQVTHYELNLHQNPGGKSMVDIILVPSQDVHFFYTLSHFSALQSCALILSTNFCLFSHLNSAPHNLVVEFCRALKIIHFLTVI